MSSYSNFSALFYIASECKQLFDLDKFYQTEN